ncbi:aldo/keto reductase, partial [Schumannella luteola]
SSKAGYDMWPGPYGDFGSRKYLLSSLDQSLGRLGLDYVDIFYHHRPDPETPIEESMGALAHAVRSGKALYAGISNYGPDDTRRAYDALRAEGVPLLIHQPSYSMFNRLPEEGLLETVEDLGIGSIVFSPLAQGLLTDRYLDGIPADSRAAEGRWITADTISDEYLDRARGLNAIAEARGQSLAQLALLWVLRQPAVTSALIGASSVRQLEDNLGALDGAPLSDEEITAIEPFAVHGTVRR